jgi:hypothetical protein
MQLKVAYKYTKNRVSGVGHWLSGYGDVSYSSLEALYAYRIT